MNRGPYRYKRIFLRPTPISLQNFEHFRCTKSMIQLRPPSSTKRLVLGEKKTFGFERSSFFTSRGRMRVSIFHVERGWLWLLIPFTTLWRFICAGRCRYFWERLESHPRVLKFKAFILFEFTCIFVMFKKWKEPRLLPFTSSSGGGKEADKLVVLACCQQPSKFVGGCSGVVGIETRLMLKLVPWTGAVGCNMVCSKSCWYVADISFADGKSEVAPKKNKRKMGCYILESKILFDGEKSRLSKFLWLQERFWVMDRISSWWF